MKEMNFEQLKQIVDAHGFNEKVARAFDQALRLERIAETLAEGDERRKRDLLIILAPCLPTRAFSVAV